MPLDILLLGPQGSGKGTQAKRISAEYGIPHIATGDMLRAAVAEGSEVGREVASILESGGLVRDDLIVELIRERLGRGDTDPGFILDGFPRTTGQAEALDAMLSEIGRSLTIVFELQVDDAVAVERLTKRAREQSRADDTPEAIGRRLELYHRETEPLVEYYRIRGNVIGIHGERPEGEVFAEIQEALEALPREETAA